MTSSNLLVSDSIVNSDINSVCDKDVVVMILTTAMMIVHDK